MIIIVIVIVLYFQKKKEQFEYYSIYYLYSVDGRIVILRSQSIDLLYIMEKEVHYFYK